MNILKNAVGIPGREWADGSWSLALREKAGEDVKDVGWCIEGITKGSNPMDATHCAKC